MVNLLLPLLTPLVTAIFCILFWQKVKVQKIVFFIGATLSLYFAGRLLWYVSQHGIVSIQIGNWAAPFGITLVADLLSAGIIVMASLTTLLVACFAQQQLDSLRMKFGFFTILLFLLFGVTGALLAGDIFNLYVWFEIIMVSTFVLLTLGGTKDQLEGSIKYVGINFLASSILLAGIGTVYGIAGTLNMADLALKIPEIEHSALVNLTAVFFIVGFGIKAAVFPLYFWLPASYPTPPVAITSMVGGLLTKIGVYVLIRFFTLIFTNDIGFTHEILIIMAGFTMVVGGLGALAQNDFHKILSLSIVSQIGYMILGLGLFTSMALAGSIFFMVHNILVKTNLFLISGIVHSSNNSFKLKELGGVYKRLPIVALCFLISAFALTGLPPLTGFWGKFLLATAGFETEAYVITFIAIGTGLFTLLYMTKIWNEVFWKKDPVIEETKEQFPSQFHFVKDNFFLLLPVAVGSLLILYIGIFPEVFINYALNASEQLMNKDLYINAVLNR